MYKEAKSAGNTCISTLQKRQIYDEISHVCEDEGAEALKTGDDEIVEEKPMQQLSVEVMQPGNIKSEPWGGWGTISIAAVVVSENFNFFH